jgi:hypothetical protein
VPILVLPLLAGDINCHPHLADEVEHVPLPKLGVFHGEGRDVVRPTEVKQQEWCPEDY